MTELTDEAVTALLAHYDLPTDCDCDGDDCVKCSHYPTFQERAAKRLKELAPDLARALLDAWAERDRLAAELAAANAREAGLREALEPFAFYGDEPNTTQEAWEIRYRDRFQDWIDFGDIEAARAALAQPSTATPTEYERKVAQMKEDFPNGI